MTTVSVRFLPSVRKVHTSNADPAKSATTPIHLDQMGSDTEDQAIHRGLIIQANTPNQNTAPRGRSVARMNTPSCLRSSFSPVDCEVNLWYMPMGSSTSITTISTARSVDSSFMCSICAAPSGARMILYSIFIKSAALAAELGQFVIRRFSVVTSVDVSLPSRV